MLRRLNRRSRLSSSEVTVYGPEPRYAVQQADDEKRRSTSSQDTGITTLQRQPSSGGGDSGGGGNSGGRGSTGGSSGGEGDVVIRVHEDETFMTLEEIKLKRKVSVSQSGKVHKKSSRNSVVDIFEDKNLQVTLDSEGSRQHRNTSDLQQ